MITEAVKERTDSYHQNIETVGRLKRLFSEDYTKEEYRALLRQFYGYHKPLERAFMESGELRELLDFTSRQRVGALEADLKTLGMSQEEIDALPESTELPRHDTLPRLVGCMYVLEGSTMGGQMISKHLSAKFGFENGEGVRFYAGYGAETMPMWKAFKGFVNENFSSSEELDQISESAAETFITMGKWLDR